VPAILARLRAFLAAVPGSVRGAVSAAEAIRVLVAALGAGSPAAFATAVLTLAGLPDAAGVVAAATAGITAVVGAIEYLRRRAHGA
jgi:hypothetical protein